MLFSFNLEAAPYPATSSSAFTDPALGHFLLHHGFKISNHGSHWLPASENDSSQDETIRFASKETSETGFITIKSEKANKTASLNLYNRKWMKEYPNYGFEVLSTTAFDLNSQPALVVDLLSRAKGKQIRQVIFKNDDKIAILTCVDDRGSFSKSLKECNEIVKNFRWTTDPSTKNLGTLKN